MKHFKVVEEETDAIYLSEKELSTIHELDLSDDKQLEEIRDVYEVFGSLLFGLQKQQELFL